MIIDFNESSMCEYHLYYVKYRFKEDETVGHAACMGERRNAYRVLVGKHERKRPFGRPKNGCYGNGMEGVGCGPG
jgi:hypothetical protein